MKGTEFIKMMREDIATHENNELLSEIVDVMEAVVTPQTEINADGKTPEDCYKEMYEHAKLNKIKCFGTKQSKKFVADYLGIKDFALECKKSDKTVLSLDELI